MDEDDPGCAYQMALEYIIENVPDEKMVQLANLLREAKTNGHGVVKIVVIDMRVDGFRLEKMYR